ncbi:hypothetical protein [Haliea sp.]
MMLALTAAAGICMPLGAVFQVLQPQGAMMVGNPSAAVLFFLLGGVLFFALERSLGLRRHWAPPLGAVFGVGVSLLAEQWLNGI